MKKGLFFLISQLLIHQCIFAQSYQKIKIEEKDGLFTNRVRGIFQDDYGAIYVANGIGFTKFYGNKVEPIRGKEGVFNWSYDIKFIRYGNKVYCDPFYLDLKLNEIERTESGTNTSMYYDGMYGDTSYMTSAAYRDSKNTIWLCSGFDKINVIFIKNRDTTDISEILEKERLSFNNLTIFTGNVTAQNSNAIPNFIEDNHGNIWIRTKDDKLLKIDPDKKNISEKIDDCRFAKSAIYDKNGNLWISTFPDNTDSAFVLKINSKKEITRFKRPGNPFVYMNEKGEVWISDARGLFRFRKNEFELIKELTGINKVVFTNDSKPVVQYQDQLSIINNQLEIKLLDAVSEWPAVFIDRENIIWVGTEEGLYKLIPMAFSHTKFNVSEDLNDLNVNTLTYRYTSKEGVRFYSSYEEACLYYLKNNQMYKLLDKRIGTWSEMVEDDAGNIYVFCNNKSKKSGLSFDFDNIYKIHPDLKTTPMIDGDLLSYQNTEKLGFARLKVIRNTIYVITNFCVFYKTPNDEFKLVEIDTTGFSGSQQVTTYSDKILLFYLNKKDSLSKFGVKNEKCKVFNYERKKFLDFNFIPDSLLKYDFDIAEDKNGNLYGFSGKVIISEFRNKFRLFRLPKIEKNERDLRLTPFAPPIILPEGKIIYNAFEQGLIYYNILTGAFKHYTVADGLDVNNFSIYISADSADIYITSEYSLQKIEISSIISGSELKIKTWNKSMGFNTSGSAEITDSAIYIYTKGGMTELKHKLPTSKIKPVLYFTEVRLFYEPVKWNDYSCKVDSINFHPIPNEMKLDYFENHLTFEFQGVCNKHPDDVKYYYMLEGYDSKFHITGNTSITYSNLNSGKYTFKVYCEDIDGNISETIQISFEVAQPFWKTIWFTVLVLSGTISIIFILFRWRLSIARKRQKELETEIEVATKEITNKNKLLEIEKHRVEEKNKEITDSITYARRIQTAILPPDKIVKEFLPDSFILYKPKDIVAGDFYWMEHSNDQTYFAACDCTGHGVPGAMVSVVCNNGLNRAVREFGLTDPGKILDKTRELVIREFEKSEEEVKDGMDISLVALKGNSLTWAGANNPLWIIRNNEIIEYKPDKQPIGKYTDPKPFTTHEIKLQKHDAIYIFTDGFQDQFGGEKGKKLKASKFKELLLSVQNKEMTEQRKIINETFENWKGNLEQNDDVCVMGVRI